MELEKMKLGKLPPKIDSRTLKLSKYTTALPSPPKQAGYVNAVTAWPMMLNDNLGDCTCACAGHMIEQWTAYTDKPFTPTDQEILTVYEAVSGYTPSDPNTDNGAVILDVLNYWRKTGIGGHKIAAYVSLNWKDDIEVKQAIQLFGNCYIGIQLPITAQNPVPGWKGLPIWGVQSTTGDGAPGSWGGHAIPIVYYGVTALGMSRKEVVTWGQLYGMTEQFLSVYGDEAYAVLSEDWIAADQESPSGFDLAQLQADLAEITA